MPLLVLLLITPLTMMLNGYVLSKLWLWLIVPTFPVDPLRVPEAIGVSMVVGFLTYHATTDHDQEGWELVIVLVVKVLAAAAIFLTAGAVVSSFL